jgi:hypothetical protein
LYAGAIPQRIVSVDREVRFMRSVTTALGLVLLSLSGAAAGAASIRGDYVEARTADVFTGPCFSNSEVFATGDHAVLAWKVTEGSWRGVDLSGLCVAAALSTTTTITQDDPERAKAVLIVDAKATPAQREALISMARKLGGARLGHVRGVATARMSLKVERHSAAVPQATHSVHGMPHAPAASFWAAGLAQIVTRPLDERDHACGNEVVAYPPLSLGVDAQPAYTLGHAFRGEGLSAQWADPNCRSSFVGRFSY